MNLRENGSTLVYSGELTVTSCWCGIKLAIPSDLYRKAQADKKVAVFCPLGHEFIYSKNATDRAQERARAAEAALERAHAATRAAYDQAQAAELSARAYKGHATRLRNRIANGVCPVAGCRRHFDNVQAHIAGQHPEWAAEHPEVIS